MKAYRINKEDIKKICPFIECDDSIAAMVINGEDKNSLVLFDDITEMSAFANAIGLKPCPFCGYSLPYVYKSGAYDTYKSNIHKDMDHDYKIVCMVCHASVTCYGNFNHVKEKWNRREGEVV